MARRNPDCPTVPVALDRQGIQDKIQAFRKSARNAIDAGFHGVEVTGVARGCLANVLHYLRLDYNLFWIIAVAPLPITAAHTPDTEDKEELVVFRCNNCSTIAATVDNIFL